MKTGITLEESKDHNEDKMPSEDLEKTDSLELLKPSKSTDSEVSFPKPDNLEGFISQTNTEQSKETSGLGSEVNPNQTSSQDKNSENGERSEEIKKQTKDVLGLINVNEEKVTSIPGSSSLHYLATEYASSEESEESDGNSSCFVVSEGSERYLSCNDSDETDSDDSDSDSSDSDSSESADTQLDKTNRNDELEAIATEIEIVTNPQAYRDQVVNVDSDPSSDSDVELIDQDNQSVETIDDDSVDDDEKDESKTNKTKKKTGSMRVKGELLIEDLPPIEDLHITVPETECVEMGKVHSIVDQLVLIDSIPGTIPLDLDTVLFLDKGRNVLGKVFDVLGQIVKPMYCVRFNSNKQIKEKKIEIGLTVYVAPRTEHTQIIILKNLLNNRGSDASWENDVEPPEGRLDYSDDEQEKNARRARSNANAKGNSSEATTEDRQESISDQESVQSDFSIPSIPRKRRIRSNNSSNAYHQRQQHQNRQTQRNYQWSPSSHQEYSQQSTSGARGFYPSYNKNAPFNHYNSGYSSWHSNFNPPYEPYGGYSNYQPSPNPSYASYGASYPTPFPTDYMQQQPLFPPPSAPPPPPPPRNN